MHSKDRPPVQQRMGFGGDVRDVRARLDGALRNFL